MEQVLDQVINLQRQVREFTEDEVLDSAELLGTFLVSISAKHSTALPPLGEGSHIESLVVFGDALKEKGELKRAIDYYKQALNQRKNIRQGSTSSSSSSILVRKSSFKSGSVFQPSAASASSSSGYISSSTGDSQSNENSSDKRQNAKMQIDPGAVEAQLKFRIARCQMKLKQKHSALKTLESINSKHRTSSMVHTMATLYNQLGMDRPTLNAYREAVKGNVYFLAGILALVRLGVAGTELAQLVSSKAHPEDLPWLIPFIEAHSLLSLSQHSAARSAFLKLKKLLPSQVHILTSLGQVEAELNEEQSAVLMFQKARAVDPKNLNGMDTFASLIRERQDPVRLNSLARELMEIDDMRAEPWLAVALFCDAKGDTMSALQFVCKAIELDPQHVAAYHLKGVIQLRMNQPELSVSSMYKAYLLRREFSSYKGLVDAYLAINKVSEALRMAKEALQLMPKDPRAVLLVGKVLAQTPGDGRKKASKAYAKALKLDPMCHQAAMAFADLYLMQHNASGDSDLQPAIQLLTQTLQYQSKDFLHVKLGDLLTAALDYGAALTQYHHALSINPDYELAKLGIERLERCIKGLDPDLDEDGDYELENEEYEQDM